MKVSGAIFDLDGTLLDSMPVWRTAGSRYLKSRGLSPAPGLDARLMRMSLRQAAETLIAEYALPEPPPAVMDGVNALIARFYREQAQPKPGAARLLEALRARGVPLCLATATDRPLVEAALRRCGLLDFFAAVFTCTEVGAGKDRPDIFEAARAFLGTPRAETWVFEDASHAARTARDAGFPVAAVYDPAETDPAALRACARVYLSSPEEMEAYLD